MLEFPRPGQKARRLTVLSVLGIAGILLFPALADAQVSGLGEYFYSLRRWGGERVVLPAPDERPDLPLAIRSFRYPISVHAGPEVPGPRVLASLEALEAAFDHLEVRGWEPPPTDGGRGGSEDFDLYLVPGGARADDAGADPRALFTYLDSASAFAVVDPTVPRQDLASCVTSAYAQAMLIGQDPAEAPGWRRATATYLTWLTLGRWGCDDGRVSDAQAASHEAWVSDETPDADGGALLLAELSARHDRGTGRFVRDVWQIARQRTWDGVDLRASPDLWEALEAALEDTPDELEELIEELAIARYFAGPAERRRGVRLWARSLPSDAAVSVMNRFTWDELPKYSAPHEPGLAPFGSAYFEVEVGAAPVGERLRLWLRGEFGVQWSFVAITLDGTGREISRYTAPSRQVPRSYLQIEFPEAPPARVLVVVTNLSSRLPDADEPDENTRSFRLIVDRRENPT